MNKSIIGRKFVRLLVIEKLTEKSKHHNCYLYYCKCDCGNIKKVESHRLKNGTVKSCGCLKRDVYRKRMLKSKQDILAVQTHLINRI